MHQLTEEFYEEFYDFPVGTNLTRAAGRKTWDLLHGLARHYPCPPCKEPFIVLMKGVHDVVNIQLDKPVHDPKNFEKFVSIVNDSAHKVRMHRRVVHQIAK